MITEMSGTGRLVSINILPDDVLLEIFDHYVIPSWRSHHHEHVDAWYTLIHVCQRWRYVVFNSSRRLDLQLLCTGKTPVTNMLHIWPALPIVVSLGVEIRPLSASGMTNIISALQQRNRVCRIDMWN